MQANRVQARPGFPFAPDCAVDKLVNPIELTQRQDEFGQALPFPSRFIRRGFRRFAGQHLDKLLCDIEVVGIQLVEMLLELLRGDRGADMLAAPEKIVGGHIEGIGEPEQVIKRWFAAAPLEMRDRTGR